MRPLLLAAALLSAAPAFAADEAAKPTTLTITAEGHFDRAPDIAELSGGVVSQAATAAAALSANATRMTSVIAAVRRAGIAPRDIATSVLSLQPQYRYTNGEAPVLTGYQVTNTVGLKVRNLPDAGRLVDALVAAGANQISGPSFRVDDAEGTLNAARDRGGRRRPRPRRAVRRRRRAARRPHPLDRRGGRRTPRAAPADDGDARQGGRCHADRAGRDDADGQRHGGVRTELGWAAPGLRMISKPRSC